MIVPYKNRSLDWDRPVYVYRNLGKHTKCLYSIKQGGLIIGHSSLIFLRDCKFIVRESGRKKVLETKQKNVHALIKGFYHENYDYVNQEPEVCYRVKYNPYENETFITSKNEPIYESMCVVLDYMGVLARIK